MLEANVNLIGNGGPVTGMDQDQMGLRRPYIDNSPILTNGKKNPFYNKACWSVYIGGQAGDRNNPANYRQELVTNATTVLRKDEWKALDEAVLSVARNRLGGVDDLRSKGLIFNLPNAMATMILEWDDQSDGMDAILTMDGITRAKNDRVVYQRNGIPIPVLHSDYEIIQRSLLASRSLGQGVDVTQAEQASRRIGEKLERMLFSADTAYSYGSLDARSRNSIYSYINFPDRNQVTLSVAWDDSAATGATILTDVKGLKDANIAANHFGGPNGYTLYVPTEYETVLDEDYSASGTSVLTIRDRILMLANVNEVKVNDTLPANNVVLVQMSTNVVRLIDGMPIQNIQWNVEGGMLNKYKVMTIQVPQCRSDQNGQTGIAHGTP